MKRIKRRPVTIGRYRNPDLDDKAAFDALGTALAQEMLSAVVSVLERQKPHRLLEARALSMLTAYAGALSRLRVEQCGGSQEQAEAMTESARVFMEEGLTLLRSKMQRPSPAEEVAHEHRR